MRKDHLSMEHEAKINALRAALIEGEESGPSTRFDFESFIARKKRSVNRYLVGTGFSPR